MSSIYSTNLPYTYLIGWSNLNVWYYGRRTAKNCHPEELWKKYFTSSNEVTKFRKKHGEPDIIQIRKTFTDSKKCSFWECRLLERIDAQHDPRFLNKRNGDYKWDTTGISRKHTNESKNKISFANKNKPKSENHKKALSISKKGQIASDETKMKLSIQRIGNKFREGILHTEETKIKMSQSAKNHWNTPQGLIRKQKLIERNKLRNQSSSK
jgi:hypothetical protein